MFNKQYCQVYINLFLYKSKLSDLHREENEVRSRNTFFFKLCVCVYIYIYIERERERVAQKASDTRSLTCSIQCQETLAHSIYASSVNRHLLILYMLPVSTDFCSSCICLQCKETLAHSVYACTVK